MGGEVRRVYGGNEDAGGFYLSWHACRLSYEEQVTESRYGLGRARPRRANGGEVDDRTWAPNQLKAGEEKGRPRSTGRRSLGLSISRVCCKLHRIWRTGRAGERGRNTCSQVAHGPRERYSDGVAPSRRQACRVMTIQRIAGSGSPGADASSSGSGFLAAPTHAPPSSRARPPPY